MNITDAEIRTARNLALLERHGTRLTDKEAAIVDIVLDAIGPEAFYMDGELFHLDNGSIR